MQLISTAMKFLSTLAARSHHCGMFEGGDTLKTVCEQVILPNLFLRGSNCLWNFGLFLEFYFRIGYRRIRRQSWRIYSKRYRKIGLGDSSSSCLRFSSSTLHLFRTASHRNLQSIHRIDATSRVRFILLFAELIHICFKGIFAKSNEELVEKRHVHLSRLGTCVQRRNTNCLLNSNWSLVLFLFFFVSKGRNYQNKFIY